VAEPHSVDVSSNAIAK